jgi:RNA polymerase sigma-70 factor (ECF subfamily)
LRTAVAELDDAERNCITLYYLEELSIRDIEKITGYKQGTIKSHLSRGREHLRAVLKKYNTDEK